MGQSPPPDSPENQPARAPNYARVALLVALLGVSVFLMSWRLSGRSLHVDEYLTCYRIEPGHDLWDNMHPLTYYAYVRWWTGLFGSSDAALRSSNIVPAAIVVAMVALVAWWLLPWPGPAVATGLVVISSELLLYWRMARYFAPVAAGFSVVVVGAVGYLRERKPWWLAVMAVGTVAAGYADYLPALSCAVPWAFVFGEAYSRGDVRRAGTIFATLGASVIALLPPIAWAVKGAMAVHQRSPHVFHLSLKTEAIKGALSFWSLLASEALPPWETLLAAVAVLGAATLAVAGGVAAWRKGGAWRMLLAIWPAAVAIAWVALEATPTEPPVRISSLALHGLPWALIVMALGWYSLRNRVLAQVALCAILLGQGTGLYNYFTLQNLLNPQYALNWSQVGDFLSSHAHPGDGLATFYDAGLLRYYKGTGLLKAEAVTLHKYGTSRLEAVLRKGGTVWLVTRDRGSARAKKLAVKVQASLVKNGATVREHPFFPYRHRELWWRHKLEGNRNSTSYVMVYELHQRHK